jgi:hypothetical protein
MSNILNEILKAQAEAADQRSQAWFNARAGKFTASEMYKLLTQPQSKEARERGDLSETTKSYIMTKIAEELTGVEQTTTTAATSWGIDHEAEAIRVYSDVCESDVSSVGFIAYGDHAGGSPDGLCSVHKVIEVKCPYNPENHIENLLIMNSQDLLRVHKNYWWQLQMNMVVTGEDEGMFISYDPRQSGKLMMALVPVRLEPNSKDIIDTAIHKASEYKKLLMDRIMNR